MRCCAMAALLAIASTPALPREATTRIDAAKLADPYFVSVGGGDAIPFGVITAQVQDARGLLWFGTQNGIVRYDGYRFRRFVHDQTDPHSLAGDFVNCLWADPDGKVWIGTSGTGLSVLDPATDKFDNFHHDEAKPESISSEEVLSIVGDGDGGHWIGTAAGLNHDRREGGFSHYRHAAGDPASLANDNVRSLLRDHAGRLWVGENDGLQRLRPDGKGFERIASDQDRAQSLSGKKIRSIFEAQDGKIWLGTGSNGPAWIAPQDMTLHWPESNSAAGAGSIGQAAVKSIAQPDANEIWLGTFGDGIIVLAASDGHIVRHLRHDASIASSIGLDTIGALSTDRNGELWIGTWGGGLQLYAANNRAFRMLRHSSAQTQSLSHADVHSALQLIDGRIAIGTGGNGIDILDPQQGLVDAYRPHASQPMRNQQTPQKPNAELPDGMILALAQAGDGTLWAGTQRMGILRLLPGAANWDIYSFGPALRDNAVNALHIDRNGDIFAATDNGVWRMRAGQRQFTDIKDSAGNAMHAPVYPLAEDPQGRMWIGTLNGLWVLEAGAEGMQGIHPQPLQKSSLGTDIIGGLLVDSEKRLWVATAQGLERLTRWDGKNAEFEHVSELAGERGQNFGSNLLEDKTGRIWSEDHVYDPAQRKIHSLTKADGLDFGVSWVGSYARTRDGMFLQGGTQGLALIDPEQYQPPSGQPPLVASELKINGIAQPFNLPQPTLMLQPGQRNFSIEFSALDYSAPQKNQYGYRLLGYDDDWIATDSGHRIASYGNLWPGRYTLEIRGSNRAGEWSRHTLSIPVLVVPAFWQTGWFLVLALLAGAAAIAGGYRWRLALLHAKATGLQKLVDARTKELTEKNRELERLAVTDRLTGLYNRLKLDQILETELARSERYGSPLALVMIDLDHFKNVNDDHGHQIGDQVLATFANILATNTRDVDAVGRWGGEEFLVIACDTDLASATELAEKLRLKVAAHAFATAGNKTASFGVTVFRPGDSAMEILARADKALYRAKEGGRDRVECTA